MVEDGGEQLGGPFSVDVVLSTLATASRAPCHAPTGPWSGRNSTKQASGHKDGRSESECRGPSLEIQSVRRQLGRPAEASRSVTHFQRNVQRLDRSADDMI